tara:strand:+ start:1038 stop:1166 length:129 start_codon:yes stop_codon:yes gene_type:complete
MTQSEALIEINAMDFPAVAEGDIAIHEGYSFTYTNGKWAITQ